MSDRYICDQCDQDEEHEFALPDLSFIIGVYVTVTHFPTGKTAAAIARSELEAKRLALEELKKRVCGEAD